MTELRECPQCGGQLPADAPQGVCPKCLMQVGFETREVAAAGNQSFDATANHTGFLAPAPEELAPHFPQFEIVQLAGKGGMGAVYKARQPKLDRYVALKILPPEVGKDPAFAERFMREARALAMLSHSSIVAVYDFGETNGLFYFVMEYVDGANLRQAIALGGVTPPEALAIVPQICDALQYAHEEGVVHRDIKPENILINKRGRVKIADFGLAKLLGVESEDSAGKKQFSLTGTQQIMGTPHYMAPEQMQGSKSVDHRADIYSLGVVFYEMLTGELPIGRFEAPSTKVRIDVRLDEVVLRSLESAPDRRYQHASDLKTGVESILGSNDAQFPLAKPVANLEMADFKSSVRNQLRIPAFGLMLAGIVNLLAAVAIVLLPVAINLLGGFAEAPEGFVEGEGTFAEASFLSVIIALFSLMSGVMVLLGAARMFDLQSLQLAMTGAILALVPCAIGFLISLPFGIWALLLLSRRDVKTAFADWNAGSERERPTNEGPGSAVGWMMAVGLALGLSFGAAVGHIGLGMTLGMVVGVVIGAIVDSNSRRNSKD
ncbi:MAG: serine/threonine-protein kinase [Pirellulaceae bacterium]